MKKSYWNNGSSFSVDKISAEALKKAIKVWAEGSAELEQLLWSCYKNKVITNGCDSGYQKHFPYLDILIEESTKENLYKILSAVEKFNQSQIMISFGGNPYSGPNWYKNSISIDPIKKKDSDSFWKSLNNELNQEEYNVEDKVFIHLLNIYEFLKDKKSELDLVLRKDESLYSISISSFLNKKNWEYYTKLFEKVGLKEKQNKDESYPFKIWEIEGLDKYEVISKLKSLLSVMKDNWTLPIPNKITEDMGFNQKALLMQHKYGFDEKGIKEMNDWLNKNKWSKELSDVNY